MPISYTFDRESLRCKGSGLLILAPGFLLAFGALSLALRREDGRSFGTLRISSGCRSREYNAKIGGHPRSLHICDFPARDTGGCCAVDILGSDPEFQRKLRAVAWDLGWSIGEAKTFTHVDLRSAYTDLPQAKFGY